MAGFAVKVYIYDLSGGLARSMSRSFLGRQIDGIWHTSIVVHGAEFFYGGDGISSCPPGGTILRQPGRIEDLGHTQVPRDTLMQYLEQISQTTFSPERYHLLDHNCNKFSSELAKFLTGKDIPSEITDLPAQVMNTPFGAMLRPFLDSMSGQNVGGQAVFPQASQSAPTRDNTNNNSAPTADLSTSPQFDLDSAKPRRTEDPIIFRESIDEITNILALDGGFALITGDAECKRLVYSACIDSLLQDDHYSSLRDVSASAIHNLSLYVNDEDDCISLGCALLECLRNPRVEDDAERLLRSLSNLSLASDQVYSIASAMDVDSAILRKLWTSSQRS